MSIYTVSDICFTPSLDIEEENGLFDTMMEMMKDMFLQTTLFPRIDPIVPIASYEGSLSYITQLQIFNVCLP